ELLADGLGLHDLVSVEFRGALREATLRRAHRDGRTREVRLELPGDAVDGVTFGHRLLDRVSDDAAGRLVLGELRNAACVALLTRERRGDEAVDEGDRLLDGVLARADRDDVGVVVLAREFRGREVPD